MSTAEMKAAGLLETHSKMTHHGSPPCQPFLDYKTDQRWIMAVAGGLILSAIGVFWSYMKESGADRMDLRMTMVKTAATNEVQFRYLVDGMAQLKLSMEQLQTAGVHPKTP